MRYQDLSIQTQREAPNNARTPGFAFLVRAGYMTRESELLPLGQQSVEHLKKLVEESGTSFFPLLSIPTIGNANETYFLLSTGPTELIHCLACGYTARADLALFAKSALPDEEMLPSEKVLTPDCHTIEDLANFLQIPQEKTAKALMYTRLTEGEFVFAVVRGDMQLSEAKLKVQVGDVRAATVEEIAASGAAAGYASPIGLQDALVIVDDLIPNSQNLVAGANESGYHLKNVNYGRDYNADIVADLVQAKAGDVCAECGQLLTEQSALELAAQGSYNVENILLALAETHHDEKGLSLPHPAAPFDVYLMQVPGKTLDTQPSAEEIYTSLQHAGVGVLFDDRNERAGVKFNDADLIGCPVRVTVGERGLQSGMVELKPRTASKNSLISLTSLTGLNNQAEFWNLVNNLDQ